MKNIEQKIKIAAFDLLSKKPMDKVKTDTIIQNAHVAKASFYYYFKDKYDVMSNILKDVILASFKNPENTTYPWRQRIYTTYKSILENFNFVKNILKYDEPYFIYYDLIKTYQDALLKHLKAVGADINEYYIIRGAEALALSDVTFVYRLVRNRIKIEEYPIMMKAWFESIPHCIYTYLSK